MGTLTKEERLAWIEGANYQELLAKWRFEPIGSPWFEGEVGAAYTKAIGVRRDQITGPEAVAASKAVGW